MSASELREGILRDFPITGQMAIDWVQGAALCPHQEDEEPDCECGRRMDRLFLAVGRAPKEAQVYTWAQELFQELRR